MYLSGFGALLLATGTFVSAATITTQSTSTSSSILAVESPKWLPNFPAHSGSLNITAGSISHKTLNLSSYPEPWTKPSATHPEVKAVIAAIDWTKVPKAPVHKSSSNGDMVMTGYDESKDPYCWWSSTNCVKPKASYLPPDISICPNTGDWGLNFDDGPFNPTGDKEEDKYAEPELYNFLSEHGNQKATLFYIGSNVVTFPEAAKFALSEKHVLCSHSYSHQSMTTLTNGEVVAELYWTLKAIKEATGVTTRCWRPPFGDVDDRVRAIAWQMGMQTILWSDDTDDWDIKYKGEGTLTTATVDGYFKKWIDARKKATEKNGLIVLQHELNGATVSMAEKWLPELQENFNVVTIQQCMNVSQPYWESDYVYPTEENNSTTPISNATSSSASAIPSSTTIILSSPAASSSSAAEVSPSVSASSINSALNAQKQESSATSLNAVYGTSVLTAAVAYAAYYL